MKKQVGKTKKTQVKVKNLKPKKDVKGGATVYGGADVNGRNRR